MNFGGVTNTADLPVLGLSVNEGGMNGNCKKHEGLSEMCRRSSGGR